MTSVNLGPTCSRVKKLKAESEAACEADVKEEEAEPSPKRLAKRPSRVGAGKRKGAAAADVKSEDGEDDDDEPEKGEPNADNDRDSKEATGAIKQEAGTCGPQQSARRRRLSSCM